MLSRDMERRKLEDILARVQRNRRHPEPQAASPAPAAPPVPRSVPKVQNRVRPVAAAAVRSPAVVRTEPIRTGTAVATFASAPSAGRLTIGELLKSTAALGSR